MESLYIKNFKRLHELTIDKLGKVNLIVGKNSVGKSTLLEAISIYVANGNGNWLATLLDERGEGIYLSNGNGDEDTAKEHYLSLFSNRKEDYSKGNTILIGESREDAGMVSISQRYIGVRMESPEEGVSRKVPVLMAEEDLPKAVDVLVTNTGLAVTVKGEVSSIPYRRRGYVLDASNNSKCLFQYVHTADFKASSNANLFDKISLSADEKYVVEALNIINPNIARISFINDSERIRANRVAIVSMKDSDKRYRLSSMGDGINRILTIILSLLNCKNGVLLLDEFENGLHYSVQDQLWEIIFMLAEKLNIQVFVTSHSSDCIRSFARMNKNGCGQLIRLSLLDNRIVPTIYDNNEDLRFATDNSIEIR